MANHSSTKKSIRKNAKRTEANTKRKSRIRTLLKRVETSIESGKKQDASDAFKTAQPELMRGVTIGLFKLNTVSRKLSRLSARIKALG